MELQDLVGLHKLTGVDFQILEADHEDRYEDAQLVHFVLDGITYTVTEDRDDGYRSAMQEIRVSKIKVTNRFKAVQVLAMMRNADYTEILDLVDLANAKVILSVGTDRSDIYYPVFVGNWTPANMHVNESQGIKP